MPLGEWSKAGAASSLGFAEQAMCIICFVHVVVQIKKIFFEYLELLL
jgi:hypothetical protein